MRLSRGGGADSSRRGAVCQRARASFPSPPPTSPAQHAASPVAREDRCLVTPTGPLGEKEEEGEE